MSYYKNAVIKAELIQKAINYLPDDEAETVTGLFPEWQIGVLYKTIGERLQYGGKRYNTKQCNEHRR